MILCVMIGYETRDPPFAPLRERAVFGPNWRAVAAKVAVGVRVTVAAAPEREGACGAAIAPV